MCDIAKLKEENLRLRAELDDANKIIKELREELERKKQMPKGGNAHRHAGNPIFYINLVKLRDNYLEIREYKTGQKKGQKYEYWAEVVKRAKEDKEVKKYIKKTGVEITQRNIKRWIDAYEMRQRKKNGLEVDESKMIRVKRDPKVSGIYQI